MSARVLPAVAATIFAIVLAIVLFVPFVAREHRKRGELGIGTAVLGFSGLLYGLGLVAYVLIPLPPIAPGFCEVFAGLRPQWEPFGSFAGLPQPHTWAQLSPLLSYEAVQQFGFNIALFVPLGMLVQHVSGRGLLITAATGFAVSLAVELTQLTGIWFVYPCPYRLFDVDDLIANTTGALVGWLLGPMLRVLPGHTAVEAGTPRPVTAFRRLLGMCCDALLLWWIGTILLRVTDVLLTSGVRPPLPRLWLESSALWFGPAIIVLALTALCGGSTLGQHAVLLRTTGSRPRAVLCRWLTGLGGLAVLEGLVHVTGLPGWGTPVVLVWCTVHAFGVTRTAGHRGITGRLAGLHVTDARQTSAVVING